MLLDPAHAGFDVVDRRARTQPTDVILCNCGKCTATGQAGAQAHAEPARGQPLLDIRAWQPLAPRSLHTDARGIARDAALQRRMSEHHAQDLHPQADVAYFKPPPAREERGRRVSVKAIHQDLLTVTSTNAPRNRYSARALTTISRPIVSASDAVNAPSVLGGIVISRTKIVRRIAEWTTEYLESLTVNPESPSPTTSHPARNETVDDITTVLTTLPVPATVYLLAIHFVERFMAAIARAAETGNPAGKNFVDVLCKSGARGPTLRLFIAGIMLADAALDDNSFGFQTWRAVSGLSNAVLRQLEMKALALLEFRITVPSDTWIKYVERLRKYNYGLLALQKGATDMPSSVIMARLLNGVLFATRASVAQATVISLDAANVTQPISQKLFELAKYTSLSMSVVSPALDRSTSVTMLSPTSTIASPSDRLSYTQPSLDAAAVSMGPPSVTSIRRMLVSPSAPRVEGAGKRKLALPVHWSPDTDPVVPKARRTSVSTAIGSERARAYAEHQSALRRAATKHAHARSLGAYQPMALDMPLRPDADSRTGAPTLVKKLLRATAAH